VLVASTNVPTTKTSPTTTPTATSERLTR
jgi:hypothetical protein